jgi:hypothetical protein
MPNTKDEAKAAPEGAVPPEDVERVVEDMSGVVERWKGRIDELKVQVDLARMDVREQAEKQVDIAQNACLAAMTRLREAGHDATASAQTLRDGIEKLLEDVKKAFEAAQAVITRS